MLTRPRLVASVTFPVVIALLAYSNGIGLPSTSAPPPALVSPSPSPTASPSEEPTPAVSVTPLPTATISPMRATR
jgi:hypothetical protein